MSALAGTQELLYKLRVDNSDAKKGLAEAKSGIADLGNASSGATGALAGLANPITLAATAAAALATAGIAAAAALYRLTTSSAEYAGAIFDVQEKTSLSAATLSTLKINADQAGSSLEAVGSGAAKFAKTLGEAQAGNEKAQQTLKDLGVNSYDLETALSQATKAIYDADGGTQQLVLSQKAFGKSGGDLIGVVKQMGGDLAAATKEAEKLGLVMSEKDLKAADGLGDALQLLGSQAKVAGVAFTSDLMPILTKYFTIASKWIGENRETIRSWGSFVASIVSNLARGISTSFNFILDNANKLRAGLAVVTFGISEMAIAAAKLLALYYQAKGYRPEGGGAQEGSGSVGLSISGLLTGGGGGGKPKAAKSGANNSDKDELEAQIAIQKLALEELEDAYKKAMASVRAEFKKTGDALAFITGANKANQQAAGGLPAILDALDALERKAQTSPTPSQTTLLNRQQAARRSGLQAMGADDVKANNEAILESEKKLADAILKIFEDLAKAQGDVEQKRLEMWRDSETERYLEQIEMGNDALANQVRLNGFLVEQAEYDKNAKLSILSQEKEARQKEINDTITDETRKHELLAALDELYKQKALLAEEEFERQKKEIAKKYGTIAADNPDEDPAKKNLGLVGSLGSELEGLGKGTIQAFANGVGSIVEQFVLLGKTGPDAMRKLTASVLAGLAAQAAIKSLYYLAEGIAALFWNPLAASGYFTASAIMAGIAVGSGVAGRAVAGNSFSQSASGSSASASSGGQSQGDRNGFTSGQFSFGERLNNTLAQVEETTNRLATRIAAFSPGDVLGMGAEQNPSAISDSFIGALDNNSRLSGTLKRVTGEAR